MKNIILISLALVAALLPMLAMAVDVVAPQTTWLSENWFVVLPAGLYAVSHVMAFFPIGAKWPTMLKQLADFISANYGNAKNANGQDAIKRRSND